MKKILSLVLVLAMCLSLCACGGANYFALGETASTDAVELTLNEVSFGKEQYVNGRNIVSENGKTFMFINFTMKNIGKATLDYFPTANDKYTYVPSAIVSVDYNGGYTYFVDNFIDYSTSSPALNELEPLGEAATYTVIISVPDEVAENTQAPLLVNFNLVNSKSKGEVVSYTIR